MVGDGVVILPTGNRIYAPCDGSVDVLFPTKHALGLTSLNGTEILIHVGIDTVKLEGKGFKSFVNQGDQVKKGDLLLEMDLDFIAQNSPSIAIPIVSMSLKWQPASVKSSRRNWRRLFQKKK